MLLINSVYRPQTPNSFTADKIKNIRIGMVKKSKSSAKNAYRNRQKNFLPNELTLTRY